MGRTVLQISARSLSTGDEHIGFIPLHGIELGPSSERFWRSQVSLSINRDGGIWIQLGFDTSDATPGKTVPLKWVDSTNSRTIVLLSPSEIFTCDVGTLYSGRWSVTSLGLSSLSDSMLKRVIHLGTPS